MAHEFAEERIPLNVDHVHYLVVIYRKYPLKRPYLSVN